MVSLQNIYIRRLAKTDFEILKMFHVKHFQNYDISDQSLMAYLTQAQYQTYGMFHVKHLVGYVIFLTCDYDADIVYIGTATNFRRRGVASTLIQHFVEQGNVSQIFLEVSIENTDAISLYQSLGFEVVSIRKKYLHNTDSYLMVKKI